MTYIAPTNDFRRQALCTRILDIAAVERVQNRAVISLHYEQAFQSTSDTFIKALARVELARTNLSACVKARNEWVARAAHYTRDFIACVNRRALRENYDAKVLGGIFR